MVTIYENFNKGAKFFHRPVTEALERIRRGKSKQTIERIRMAQTKEEADEVKKTLPCVCFSGKFGVDHTDSSLELHSGFLVLDFDDVPEVEKRKAELCEWEHTYACWISPRGTGLKVLVKIFDGSKHRQHFAALKKHFPEVDKTGVNVSRLCFESYDPDIFVNQQSKVWSKIIEVEYENQPQMQAVVTEDDAEIFHKLTTWLKNKGDAFRTGERNHYVFKLAASTNRFGILESTATALIGGHISVDSTFSYKECVATIRSAYSRLQSQWNTAEFSNDKLVDKKTRVEVETDLSPDIIKDLNRQNIVYGDDVKDDVMDIYDNGYQKVHGIGIPEIDRHYKRKPGELTVFTGYGNMGKSTYWLWYLTMRAILFGEKVAIFSPESAPEQDFYFDLTEIYLGANCTPSNPDRPDREAFEKARKWVNNHFICVAPQVLSPTPEVIKETFLSLIMTDGVKSVVIDPFNQMANDYSTSGGRSDKYLETFLGDCARFAKKNNVNFDIIAHPKTPPGSEKNAKGDYDCPDQFRISDGSMWNNKADNILVYHRPFGFSEPKSTECEVHSKKIRRQKIVGEKGVVEISYIRSKRRFIVNGFDHMEAALRLQREKSHATELVKPAINPAASSFHISSQEVKDAEEEPDPYSTDPLNGY